MKCGRTPAATGKLPRAAHVLPKSKFPRFALALNNVQLLCGKCFASVDETMIVDYRNSKHVKIIENYEDRKHSLSPLQRSFLSQYKNKNRKKKTLTEIQRRIAQTRKTYPEYNSQSVRQKRKNKNLQLKFADDMRKAVNKQEVYKYYISVYGNEIVDPYVRTYKMTHWIK